MKRLTALLGISLLAFLVQDTTAFAGKGCSTRALAGQWVFATDVGRQMLGDPFPPGKDITAIGTMNVDRRGNLEGSFDVTVQDTIFIPGVGYGGSITVDPDCTGTVEFVTTVGSMRSDSIVVVNQNELLGMSQDVNNLWTYEVRRIRGGHDDD